MQKSSHHRLRLQNYLLDQVLLLALQGRQEGCTHLSTSVVMCKKEPATCRNNPPLAYLLDGSHGERACI